MHAGDAEWRRRHAAVLRGSASRKMNPPSLPTFSGDKHMIARSVKPWWTARLSPADPMGGPLDPAAPRALWRLIHIGEMTGLVPASSESLMLEAFRGAEQGRPAIAAELVRFQCSLTDLYILVTLFSATPRAVPLSVLSRETLADTLSLRKSLDRLDEMRAISTHVDANGRLLIALTSSGLNLAVLVTYRVINASVEA